MYTQACAGMCRHLPECYVMLDPIGGSLIGRQNQKKNLQGANHWTAHAGIHVLLYVLVISMALLLLT